jgi:uncharacterized radical SAM superfamily Fe-S cluster-containing enzyme
MYHRFEKYNTVGNGITNPQKNAPPGSCPGSCGLCGSHRSQTLLANIDVTNRCNLDCSFCFANARASGFVYEPSFDDVVRMMQVLRAQQPVPVPAVQFSGGEPTMRDDLPRIIRKAKEMGFLQVQLATNGVRIAEDPELAGELKDAGLSTVYLHFDGISCISNPLLKIHEETIARAGLARLGIVLVPTVIRGKNDHEIGDIIRFAVKNKPVIRGVNFQPVAFTGAASNADIETARITIPDVLQGIEDQTQGILRKEDFYPVPCVIPFSDLADAFTGKPHVRFTAHQHCGAATYVFVRPDGTIMPVNRMVDVDALLSSIGKMAAAFRKGGIVNKYRALLEGVVKMHDTVRKWENGTTWDLGMMIGRILIDQNFDALREFHRDAVFIGTMHFMDRFNYDLDRVNRCCIHYATPDGRLIPFCAYNSGPVYREQIWKEYSENHPASGTGRMHLGKRY